MSMTIILSYYPFIFNLLLYHYIIYDNIAEYRQEYEFIQAIVFKEKMHA